MGFAHNGDMARPSPGTPQSDHPNPDNQVQTIQGNIGSISRAGLNKKLRSSLRISLTSAGLSQMADTPGLFDGGQPAFVVLGGHHQMGTEGCDAVLADVFHQLLAVQGGML